MRAITLIACMAMLCVGTHAHANTLIYDFPLEADQNPIPNSSTGTGNCSVTLNDETGEVSVDCTFSGLDGPATAAHLHGLAEPGVNAKALVTLTATKATEGIIIGTGVLDPAEVTGMIDGLTYLNVHSQEFPAGELRGQVSVPFLINPGLNDAWSNRSTAGQGFLVVVFPDSGTMFVAWFTYDTERPPDDVMAILGEPGHRWLTAQGPYDGDTATLDVFLTAGGVFNMIEPVPETSDPIGSITIVWRNCKNGTLTYDIPSLELMNSIQISRVALDNVALCEALNAQ